MGLPVWPNPDQLKSLHQKDGLFSAEWPQPIVTSASGQASVEIEPPVPAVARIALTPRSERQ
jgi:hypothetical protein